MGKGDTRRPTQVDEETFAERWRRAFEDAGIEPEDPTEDLFEIVMPGDTDQERRMCCCGGSGCGERYG